MPQMRIPMSRLLAGLIVSAILSGVSLLPAKAIAGTAPATGLVPYSYQIGTPTLTELWVAVNGNDANSGRTINAPLKTLTATFAKIPATLTTTGYRINLLEGTYPCEPAEADNCQNNFGNRQGTFEFPIILRAYTPGTVTLRGGLDLWNLSYLYLMDLTLAGGTPLPTNASGNNLLHLANVDHVLLRGLTLDGPNCAADSCNNLQEVLKVNQAQYLYVENSEIGGAWHSAVDYFAVQHGHFINNDVHTAGQWSMYAKGGTSYLRIEGNKIHNSQLGFSAGQSANFAMMRPPWLHYEVYDIKFVNNILHDIPGVGLNVAGGYNVLFAYNTLYHVGFSTEVGYPLLSAVRGERGCNPTDELPMPVATCRDYIDQGGWGPNYQTDNLEAIPNKNIYCYNNIFYNPAPARTMYTHLSILDPIARPAGFPNLPATIRTDSGLAIRGNVIWNGDAAMPLGIEETQACQETNPTCNETLIKAQNTINTIEPILANPAAGNFQPVGNLTTTTYAIPNFTWNMASVPAGDTSNAVATDFQGVTRDAIDPPGAYHDPAPPLVLSSVRQDPSPTRANSVRFIVTFSEPVTGVNVSDFTLAAISVSGATVSSVSGSGETYAVTVTTGSGSGTLRLKVVDNDTIRDTDSNPLGGSGRGNGNFAKGQSYVVRPLTQTFTSIGANDGWILESTESGNQGGTLNALAQTFRLGDDPANRQYRAILSFAMNLPANAVITRATLKINREGLVGTEPFASLGNILVDIVTGTFSNNIALQNSDFMATASRNTIAAITNTPVGSWYSKDLSNTAFPLINRTGVTQLRLRFSMDDNNNRVADFLKFFSGNASVVASRPKLMIEYYLP